jgi:hypothetical protein
MTVSERNRNAINWKTEIYNINQKCAFDVIVIVVSSSTLILIMRFVIAILISISSYCVGAVHIYKQIKSPQKKNHRRMKKYLIKTVEMLDSKK